MINVIQHIKGALKFIMALKVRIIIRAKIAFHLNSAHGFTLFLVKLNAINYLLSSALFMNFHFGLICWRRPTCNHRMKQMEVHGNEAAKWKKLNYNFEFKTINCINCFVFYSLKHASIFRSSLSHRIFPWWTRKKRLWSIKLFVNLMNGTILIWMHTICRHFSYWNCVWRNWKMKIPNKLHIIRLSDIISNMMMNLTKLNAK